VRVGLCWAGSASHRNDAVRSLTPGCLAPLLAVPGVEWVSVAKDAWTPEIGAAGLPDGLDGCKDWLDTAERLTTLDLLVTVDTAVAHVAGGLGVPVWLMLAAVPDMRWMLDRSDTPWYTTARLYRQQVVGEWMPVIHEVAADLFIAATAHRLKEAA